MKTLAAGLLSDYKQPTATLTTCWKVTRRDTKVFGYTSLDEDLTVQGVTYSATLGVAASAIASSNKFEIQNVEVQGLLNDALMTLGAITEADIVAGVWDGARITIFETNYVDPTRGTNTLQTGRIGQLTTGALTYSADLRGLMQQLQQNVGLTVLPGCFKDLFDVNCQVDPTGFTYSGTVSTTINDIRWIDSALSQPDHQCRFGKVTWLTGANATLAMEVKDQSAQGDVILQSNMPYPIVDGDTYTITAGCNKLLKHSELVYGGTISSAVTSTDGTSIVDSGLTQDDHFWDSALFTWTSGLNNGIETEVSNFIQQTISLLGSMPFAITVGDTFTIAPLETTGNLVYDGDCSPAKFDNAVNHGGFAEVPGNDKVLGAGNQ